MLAFIFIAVLIAGVVGWATSGRGGGGANRMPPVQVPATYPGQPVPIMIPDQLADARADAEHWVELLGAGLTQLDGAPSGEVSRTDTLRQSLGQAAERLTSARTQLSRATTQRQFQLAGQTALEGLYHLRSARGALGLDPGPDLQLTAMNSQSAVGAPVLTGTRTVVVNGQEHVASAQRLDSTPYYYSGGTIAGRNIPAGWYSSPWWKKAMIGGAAGLGSLFVLDALFGHHGGMGGFGGHGGGPFDQLGAGGGPGGGFGGGFGDWL